MYRKDPTSLPRVEKIESHAAMAFFLVFTRREYSAEFAAYRSPSYTLIPHRGTPSGGAENTGEVY